MLVPLLKLLIFVILALSLCGLFYLLIKKRVISDTLHNALDVLDKVSSERERELKRNILLRDAQEETGWSKWFDKPRKRFLYARIGSLVPGLKVEIWIIIKAAFTVAIYFIGIALTKRMLNGMILSALFWILLYGGENLLALYNYKRVDANLINLIDMLGSFSVTHGEIAGMLYRVSRYFPDPLRSVLEEFYDEARTSGDISAALYSMAEKIEHPSFKELCWNIESCVRYTANFHVILSSGRKITLDEQNAKNDRKKYASGAIWKLVLIEALQILAMIALQKGLNLPLQDIFTTESGKTCLAIVLIAMLLFFVEVVNAER